MRLARGRSFSGRLTRLMAASSALLLTLACLVLVLYDRETVRGDMVLDMQTDAEIIAENSTAPLVFADPVSARQIMQALHAEPGVTTAVLFDASGKVFARYLREGVDGTGSVPGPEADGYRFEPDRLLLFRSIMLDGKPVGTLLLSSDLDALAVRMRGWLRLMSLLIPASILFAFVVARGLGRLMSRPILRLAEAAGEIGRGHLDVRAPVESEDEVGTLARAFNRMIDDLSATTVSRDYVDNIIRSMADALVVVLPDGTIQTVNNATKKLLGYAQEDSVGRPFTLILEGGLDIRRLEAGGSFVNVERLCRTKAGEPMPVSFSASALKHEDGTLQGVVCVAQDMTHQKRVLDEVRQREKQHAALADLWRLALSAAGPGRLIQETLERICAILGVKHASLLKLLPDGDRLVLKAGVGWSEGLVGVATVPTGNGSMSGFALMSDGPVIVEDLRRETRFTRASALLEHGVVSAVCSVVQGPERPFGVLGAYSVDRRVFTRDDVHFLEVTAQLLGEAFARQRANDALRDREERLRQLTENMKEVFWITTPGAEQILYVSPAYEQVWGRSREELTRSPRQWFDAIHPEDQERVAGALSLIAEDGYLAEFRVVRPDGQVRWVRDRGSPVRNEAGEVYRLVGLAEDFTDQKIAQEELKRATAAALEASRAKSEFLANMSHEIRTPMNGIIGMTDLALDTQLTVEQRDYLETVKVSADSLLTIINDILDFSKIEAGKLDLERIRFRFRESLKDTLRTIAPRAHQKGLELVCDVDPEVPDAVNGDPSRLRQVLLNLLGNAVKFTSQGEVVLRVRVESRAAESLVLHFEVADTGVGIPSHKHKTIFEAFSQADGTTTRRYGGTGLGLTISLQLVDMMSGRIWVESEPGKGSTFHFTVELGTAAAAAPPRPAVVADLSGMRLLVVDDNATNLRILGEMARGWRMQPELVSDGASALEALERARLDGAPFPLALVDAQMPGMDGFTLCGQVRTRPALSSTVLVMLTSAGVRGDASRCREIGVAAYLIKPILAAELLDCIRTVLSGDPAATDALSPSPVTRHSLRESRRRLSILLAEDNPINQAVAIRLIEKRGHHVCAVEDGQEAIEALRREAFDVVLMDVQMPRMDGMEATARIRAAEAGTGRHQPIIALTAHAMKGDRERCLDAGMDDYVSKPLRPEDLFAAIEHLVAIEGPVDPAASPSPSPSPSLDREALLARIDGDLELLEAMARMFVEHAPGMLQEIRAGVERGRATEVEAAAHKLKGSLQTIAADAAARLAQEIEQMGREGRVESVPASIEALETEVRRLVRELWSMTRGEMTQ